MKTKRIKQCIIALENEIKNKKNNKVLIDLLVKAQADELLAAYQYWVCKNLSKGNGKEEADSEFDQHFKEEMQHADNLSKRIIELDGNLITDPSDWEKMGNKWTEVTTSDIVEQLNITIKAEQDAILYYQSIMDYTKGFDEVTAKIIQEILDDEKEHEVDLKKILDRL